MFGIGYEYVAMRERGQRVAKKVAGLMDEVLRNIELALRELRNVNVHGYGAIYYASFYLEDAVEELNEALRFMKQEIVSLFSYMHNNAWRGYTDLSGSMIKLKTVMMMLHILYQARNPEPVAQVLGVKPDLFRVVDVAIDIIEGAEREVEIWRDVLSGK